jgi:hypothetical protein
VFVYKGDSEIVAKRYGHLPFPYFAVSDEDGRLHKLLRAYEVPRLYEVNGLGEVTAAETGDRAVDQMRK